MRNALIIFISSLALLACAGEEEMASSASMSAAPPSAEEVLANVKAAMGAENLLLYTVSGEAWKFRWSIRRRQ